MTSGIPSFSQQEVNHFLGCTEDPISLESRKTSYALVPCGHTMTHISAIKLLGLEKDLVDAGGNLQLNNQGQCPICRSKIFTYIPNNNLKWVTMFLKQIQPIGQASGESRFAFPYPGKRAHFECTSPWAFNLTDRPIGPHRKMVFKSTTPDSLIAEIRVLGYSINGNDVLSSNRRHPIGIEIQCAPSQVENFKKYLQLFDFSVSSFFLGIADRDVPGTFVANNPSDHDWLIWFLFCNNAFPKADYEFMKNLIKSRDWIQHENEIEASNVKKRKACDGQLASETTNHEVILVRCGDSLPESIAKRMFGKPRDNLGLEAGGGSCPQCRRGVMTYLPNYALSEASRVLDQIQARVASILPVSVPEEPQEESLPILPFLGVRANFECVSPPWNEQADNPAIPLQKSMHFKSTTPSFLASVDVFGYRDGHITIRVTASYAQKDAFEKYLKSVGITLDWNTYMSGSFTANKPQYLKWTLQFLSENNTFTEADLTFIRRLVEAKNWRQLKDVSSSSLSKSSSSVSMHVRESSNLESKASPPPATMNAQEAQPVCPMSDDEERPHVMADDLD